MAAEGDVTPEEAVGAGGDVSSYRPLFDTHMFTGNLVEDLIFSQDVCADDASAAALRRKQRLQDLTEKVDKIAESLSDKRTVYASTRTAASDERSSDSDSEQAAIDDEKNGGRDRRDANNNLRSIRQSISHGGGCTSNYRRRYTSRKRKKLSLQQSSVTLGALKTHRHDWSTYRPRGGRSYVPQLLFTVNSSISPLLVPHFRERIVREKLEKLLSIFASALPEESTEHFEISLGGGGSGGGTVKLSAIPFWIPDQSNYKLYIVVITSTEKLIDFIYVDVAAELQRQHSYNDGHRE